MRNVVQREQGKMPKFGKLLQFKIIYPQLLVLM